MSQLFSVKYFEENFRQYLDMNRQMKKIDAMNSYYRTVVSSLVNQQLIKSNDIVQRIRNLDQAYENIKAEK
jgi:hypothetical protein